MKNPLSASAICLGRGSLDNATGKRERSNNCGPRQIGKSVLPPGFLYSPFTAADEKIPLSIGQVNSKPQYLVFSSHLQHPPAKPGQSACGKPEMPCRTRLSSDKTASNPVQTPSFPRRFVSPPKPMPHSARKQGAESRISLCELWTIGPFSLRPSNLCRHQTLLA